MHLFRVVGDAKMNMSDSACVIHIMLVLILDLGRLARTVRNIWIRQTIRSFMKTPLPNFESASVV
jgi:hypothetical protein